NEPYLDSAYSTTCTTEFLSAKDYCATTRFTTAMPHLHRMVSSSTCRWLRSNKLLPRKIEPLNLDAKQASIPSAVKYVHNSSLWEDPLMKTILKKRANGASAAMDCRDFHSAHFWRN